MLKHNAQNLRDDLIELELAHLHVCIEALCVTRNNGIQDNEWVVVIEVDTPSVYEWLKALAHITLYDSVMIRVIQK